jgi:DNA-directed RNA polymerase specialized sigma24 family protein
MQTDERNIEEFCREEYAEVYRYAWTLLGNQDDALEVVQESFLRLHRLWLAGDSFERMRAAFSDCTQSSAG